MKKRKYIPKRSKSERSKIIAKLDKLISDTVRERDNWTCQRCGRTNKNKKVMTCSHYWSRRHIGTRFSLNNCITLCYPCHMFHWESEKQGAYKAFMLKKLGKEEFLQLEYEATNITKWTTVELKMMYISLKDECQQVLNEKK